MDGFEQVKKDGPFWLQALQIFERQVLIFPLLTVLLACGSFLLGGNCAAWQWWVAVAVVCGGPFGYWKKWRAALGAAGMFSLLLFALKCLLPPIFWDHTGAQDMAFYHLPMTQLLIEGWNPVADPLAEGIVASLGLDLWGMAPWYVAFYEKPMAVFEAVAYLFVGDPTALTLPGIVFLWMGVFLAVNRMYRGWLRWMAFAATVFVLPMVAARKPADMELACASFGLLLAMHEALKTKKCNWLSLFVWAAWMMNLKHNGVLGAFVFCSLFSFSLLWRNRTDWKTWAKALSIYASGLVLFWGILSWNPLGTSWKTYGHPLYPFKTIDEARFPSKNLTGITEGNDDACKMGKCGTFFHAYVSPRWTEAFYRCKLGQADFRPERVYWSWGEFPTWKSRILLWLMFAVLFVFPQGRLWGTGGLFLLGIVSNDYIGFTRYQPWLSALGCLCVIFVTEWIAARLGKRFMTVLSWATCGVLGVTGVCWGWHHGKDVEVKGAEMSLTRERIRPQFWVNGPPRENYLQALRTKNFTPTYNYLTSMSNRSHLLAREMWGEGKTKVLSPAGMTRHQGLDIEWDERNWPGGGGTGQDGKMTGGEFVPWKDYNVWDGAYDDSDVEAWMMTPFGYWVPVDEQAKHVIEYYTVGGRMNGETRAEQLWRKMQYAMRAWGRTYPQEVWKWLIGKHRGQMREQANSAPKKDNGTDDFNQTGV